MPLALLLSLAARAPMVVLNRIDRLPGSWNLLRPWYRLHRSRITWVAVSEAAKATLVEGGVPPQFVLVIPDPVASEKIASSIERRPRDGDDTTVVAYLGGCSERKGFPFLARVVERMAGGEVRFVVVAKQADSLDLSPACREALDSLERKARAGGVELHRGRVDAKEIYADSDVLFVPSRSEGFCRIAAEAMANGLPVVGSDIPAVRELIDRSGGGVVYEPGDLEQACARLRRLVEDGDERKRLGARGRRFALDLEPSLVSARFSAIYRRGAGRRAR